MPYKKQTLSLLVLIIGLSGCGGWKKSKNKIQSSPTQNKKMTALDINIPLSQDAITIADDESIRNFFDQDIEEFISLAQNDASSQEPQTIAYTNTPDDTKDFTWMDNSSKQDNEFKTIHFNFDEYVIRKDQENIALADILQAQNILTEAHKNNKQVTFIVEGHACDSAGSSVYNLALSEKRAKIIADMLTSHQVPKENIKLVARGTEVPVIVNGKPITGNKNQQSLNRRVEMRVIYS